MIVSTECLSTSNEKVGNLNSIYSLVYTTLNKMQWFRSSPNQPFASQLYHKMNQLSCHPNVFVQLEYFFWFGTSSIARAGRQVRFSHFYGTVVIFVRPIPFKELLHEHIYHKPKYIPLDFAKSHIFVRSLHSSTRVDMVLKSPATKALITLVIGYICHKGVSEAMLSWLFMTLRSRRQL